ncbi:MAG: S24 family peptidase [Acidobacteriota bacterium]
MHAQTRRQSQVLDFMLRHIESHGHRPSYALIARQFGLSSRAGIGRIVRDLEEQGLLTRRRENGHFYIDVGSTNGPVPAGGVLVEWLELPAEGRRLEGYQERPLIMPEFMLGQHVASRVRAYRVPDDTLASENIFEDDISIIELRKFVRDGDTVAAIVEAKSAVLRKYYRVGAYIELRPAGEFEPDDIIRMPADHIDILGLHRALMRPIS